MKALFENMDLFSHKFSFNYRRKEVFHSFLGMIFSFIIYSVMVYFSYYFSKDFIRSTNPKITYRETEFNSQYEFPIEKLFKYFVVYIRIDYNFYNETEESDVNQMTLLNNDFAFFYMKSVNSSTTYDSTSKIKFKTSFKSITEYDCMEGSSKLCKYILVGWDASNLTINSYGKEEHIIKDNVIFGRNESVPFDETTKINFYADPHINLVFGLEFDKKFSLELGNITKYIYTELGMADYTIDTNYIGFFKEYQNVYANHMYSEKQPKEYEHSEISYQMVTKKDDKGVILSDFDETVEYQKKNTFTKSNKEYFLSDKKLVSVKFDKVMKHYDRVYRKLQNIFADVGGIFNSLLLLGNLIIFQFNTKKFNYDIINFLFHSDEDNFKNETFKKSNGKEVLEFSKTDPIPQNKLNTKKKNFHHDSSIRSNYENNGTQREKSNLFMDESHLEIKNLNNNPDNTSIKNKDFKSPLKKNRINETNFEMNPFNNKEIEMVKSSLSQKDIEEGLSDDKKLEERINICLKNQKGSKRKFIIFTNSEFFKLFLCCKSLKSEALQEKEKVFISAENKIMDYFDILTYTRFHEEFEKLKSFVFDPYQLYAFEFTKNRKISEIIKMDYSKRVLESVKHFKKKIKENDLDDWDNKLFQSLNKEFISFIHSL